MRTALRIILGVGGVAAVGIAMLHIVIGPSSVPGSVPVNATMDSEDRFYATLFLAYGAVLLWCTRGVERKTRIVKGLAGVFFLGGVARVVSVIAVGWPHPFFVAMTGLELGLPFLLWWMAGRVGAAAGGGESGSGAVVGG